MNTTFITENGNPSNYVKIIEKNLAKKGYVPDDDVWEDTAE